MKLSLDELKLLHLALEVMVDRITEKDDPALNSILSSVVELNSRVVEEAERQ